MTTLAIRLPEKTSLRLEQLAVSRGMSLNKLMEALGVAALAAHDAEARLRLSARGARSSGAPGRAGVPGRDRWNGGAIAPPLCQARAINRRFNSAWPDEWVFSRMRAR